MPPKKKTEDTSIPGPDAGVNAAEAAAAEATGDDADLIVEFRGEKFQIPQDRFGTASYAMAVASGKDHKLLYEILGPLDADRYIRLCTPGESFAVPATEFFEAFNKAAGSGNS